MNNLLKMLSSDTASILKFLRVHEGFQEGLKMIKINVFFRV